MTTAVILPAPADFDAWRDIARGLLAAEIRPEETEWHVAGDTPGLFATAAPPARTPAGPPRHRVPKGFLELAEVAIRHRDPERLMLLYRTLWRVTHGEHALLEVATDPDIARLQAMTKAVRRDAHKMHAFLRFRHVRTEAGLRHIAWFEPEHHIEQAEAGFFVRRFAGLLWTIVTPRCTVQWNGDRIAFGPGGNRFDVPRDDATEALWRAYYAAVFNPARMKPGAMLSEMPRKYWRNMPETAEIPRLLREAPRRAEEMIARGAAPPNPRPQRGVYLHDQGGDAMDLLDVGTDPRAALEALKRELAGRNDLPDFARRATQLVFGEGRIGAPLMFVGEQPGDEEDLKGRPFVGPAGRLFDRAMGDAEVPRDEAYVTNAVKHFKFAPTGKRRLHQSPDAGDIAYYRPFLLREIGIVSPRLLVALGATALRALTGKSLPVMKTRGTTVDGPDGLPVFATVHPSYLLRLPDQAAQQREYGRFVEDLRTAQGLVA